MRKNKEGSKLIAISFDDGPNLTTSMRVLDKLEKYNIPASFFFIGKNITDNTKPVITRMLNLGCEINNHSWKHLHMDLLSKEELIDEVKKTSDKIREISGVCPAYFRPPFAAVSNTMYETIDLPFVSGINCSDWLDEVTTDQRAETILSNAKDGDVIVLHDREGNKKTVAALDKIIPGLLDKGYTFVTIGQLFEYKQVDPNKDKLWRNVLE